MRRPCFPSTSFSRLFGNTFRTLEVAKQHSTKIMEVVESPIPTAFISKTDRFKGVTVISTDQKCGQEDFAEKLALALDQWKEQNCRGVWFYVDLKQSEWIPVLASQGFKFHHSPSPDQVAMIKWLPHDEANGIPHYAHHMVGVGGMVVNDKDEVLAVQEKYHVTPHWKLPGGYVDPGEDLADAAIREIFEETGIRTEFQSIIAFRHGHGFNFGCSDFYFIVCLRPLTNEIQQCERELSKCEWMPLQEYATHPLVHATNRHFVQAFLKNRERGTAIGCTEIELRIKDFVRKQRVYSLEFSDESTKVNGVSKDS